jgi:uncharacterized protein YoxC
MGLAKFIISSILTAIFLYLVIVGIQNVMQSQKELEEAQKAADQVKKEYEQTKEETDRLVCTARGMEAEPMCAKFRSD